MKHKTFLFLLLFSTTKLFPMLLPCKPKATQRKRTTQEYAISPTEIKTKTKSYLDMLFDKTLDQIQTTFKRLPKPVRLKILQSSGDAKPIILMSMLPVEKQIDVLEQITDLDRCSAELFYTMPIGMALTRYKQSSQMRQQYPIYLPDSTFLPTGTYVRLDKHTSALLYKISSIIQTNDILQQKQQDVYVAIQILNTCHDACIKEEQDYFSTIKQNSQSSEIKILHSKEYHHLTDKDLTDLKHIGETIKKIKKQERKKLAILHNNHQNEINALQQSLQNILMQEIILSNEDLTLLSAVPVDIKKQLLINAQYKNMPSLTEYRACRLDSFKHGCSAMLLFIKDIIYDIPLLLKFYSIRGCCSIIYYNDYSIKFVFTIVTDYLKELIYYVPFVSIPFGTINGLHACISHYKNSIASLIHNKTVHNFIE